MEEPKPEDIKSLTINGKLIANYAIDKKILFIKRRKDDLSEDFIAEIIRSVEKEKFNHISYLNIK